jgi:hypothetical protein
MNFIFTYTTGDMDTAKSQMMSSGNTSISIEGPFTVNIEAVDFDSVREVALSHAQQQSNNQFINAIHITNQSDSEKIYVKNRDGYPGGIWTQSEWELFHFNSMIGGN